MAPSDGIEPSFLGLGRQDRSIGEGKWSEWQESNLRSPDPKSGALAARLHSVNGASDGCRTRLGFLDREVQSRIATDALEDQEGIEPINLALKRRRLIPTSYWSVNGASRRTRTFDLSLIGRASWPLNDGSMVGRCGFDPLPRGRVLQTRCRSHRLSLPVNWSHRSGSN